MRIFLTGATGFVGSHVLVELLAAGHQVVGLARSDAGAQQLARAGVEVHRGTIEDLDSLQAGAERADAVIHTAFNHDFASYLASCEQDRAVIAALGSVLRGSDRPLLITSATAIGSAGDGRPATEAVFDARHPLPRVASEKAGNALLEAGVDVRVVRLPQVHDTIKQGLITSYIDQARRTGSVAYIGEGSNRWSAGHVRDVARAYALVLEVGRRGARYHAVGEEGVALRSIAEAVANGLNLPVASLPPSEAERHFGWLSMFAGIDMAAASAWTREQLGWVPEGPGLIADLEAMDYSGPLTA